MSDTRGPKIIISLWILTILAFVLMVLRFVCKYWYSKGFGGLDDIILFISWVFVLLFCVFTGTVAVSYGLGKHIQDIDPRNLHTLFKHLFLGEFFISFAVAATKTSFSLTLLRITVREWHKWFIWFLMVSTNLVMFTCAFLFFFQCTPVEKLWDWRVEGKCLAPTVVGYYSVFAAAYSVCTDFLLAMCPWLIIRQLQMNRKEKAGVIAAMSLGMLAGIAAIVKMTFLPNSIYWKDLLYESANLLIWATVECSLCIIAASIPFLRVLVRDASSSRASRPYGQSYQLSGGLGSRNMTSRTQRRSQKQRGNDGLSEKSILNESGTMLAVEMGGIMKAQEIRVEWEGLDGESLSRRQSQNTESARARS
ncbi:uncharacterized protein BDR25DRAFT_343594 [Lindgomyces ingoldianus]|uniref:Uncharacterized protein n=1 Tax=Lindgomyces ingoldianus TaxID=673940 RepID=A0ACB6QTT9_9PLEO|nr:uncharacterized protein BDR25DRAFT_343594 [Lindgomyces ingoldianus]KAF2469581.1 hypothetical protein BDR25DRAFT_343594 [Lindgomyces ingoldianus]